MPNILAGALDVLREECALAQMVNKNFDNTEGKIGQTVNIAKSQVLTTAAVTPAAVPPNPVDITLGYTQITINTWQKATFYMNVQDATFFQSGMIIPLQMKEAVRALAKKLNNDLFALHTNIYSATGTAGTNPFATNVNPVADVKKLLDDQYVSQSGRALILGHAEVAAGLKTQDLKYMLYAGDNNALRRGALGGLYGFETAIDGLVPTFVAGTYTGTVTANGVNALAATVFSFATAGASSLTGKVGDIFTKAGDSQQYVLTSTITIGASTNGTANIQPPLQVATAGGEAITFLTTTGASYRVNIGGDLTGIGLVMRVPPSSVEGGPIYGNHMSMTDPVTGMSIKLSQLPGYHLSQWEVSIMYGMAMIDPRKFVKLLG